MEDWQAEQAIRWVRFALRKWKRFDLAEDNLESVALEVITRRAPRWTPELCAWSTFCVRITQWTVHDVLRHRNGARRVYRRPDGSLSDAKPGYSHSPLVHDFNEGEWDYPEVFTEDDYRSIEAVALLKSLLAVDLTHRQREAVMWVHYYGRPAIDLARALGVTESAVSFNLRHGLARIRRGIDSQSSEGLGSVP